MPEQVCITTMDGKKHYLNLAQPWAAFLHEFMVNGGILSDRMFIDRKYVALLELLPAGFVEPRPTAQVLHLVPPETPPGA